MHLLWLYVVTVIVIVVVVNSQNPEEVALNRHTREKEYKDCVAVQKERLPNGVYSVSPSGTKFEVQCQDGWMVVLLNEVADQTFNADWKSYWNGFGRNWKGLKYLHEMSLNKPLHLRIDLVAADGTKAFAEYGTFSVGSKADKGRLTIGGYSAASTAGDSLTPTTRLEGLNYPADKLNVNNMQFSTNDSDNDRWDQNCATTSGGGWWFNECYAAGLTVNKKIWYTFKKWETLSKVTMAVKLDVDECLSNPCQNSGTCTDQRNGYQCQCAPGYAGLQCQTDLDECLSNPCQNSGTCTDQLNGYLCQCAPGYEGLQCQTDVDECLSNPCQNNGTCTDQLNGYLCQCAPGYEGLQCQTDVDECLSNPCQNNGTCTDQLNGYQCQCAPGYEGLQCQTDVDECLSNPCQNNGTCTDQLNGYQCQCAPGYAGLKCQTDLDECLSNPCQNSGTCTDQLNGYLCQCAPGYEGLQCQTAKPTSCVDSRSSSPVSGVVTIYPDNVTPVEVYCDQDTAGGGWAVFQRRQNGSVDFYRNWADYQNQFGDLNGEFWIGLDALHTLTSSQPQELRVDLTKWDLTRVSASYGGFNIRDGNDNYRLKIASFLGGNAGDSLIKYNSGMQFSTNDTDHDVWGGGSCAEWLHGAWWYETCSPSNLNGQYKHSALNKGGLFWHSAEGVSYSMKATEMKMRPAKPTSCVDSRLFSLVSGVVTIYPDNVTPVEVYCDQDTDGGGWAVFQRRQNGSVNFYRNWADYQNQFGDLNGEFWIGLDALHTLTSSQPQELRVDLTKWDLNRVSASYSGFTISDGDDNYRLKIASFLGGSAGDSLIKYNSGMQFSTNDTDHDVWGGGSCAEWLHGAWWYETCSPSNLNGQYKHSALNKGGLFWHSAEGVTYSMKATEMKMRPAKPTSCVDSRSFSLVSGVVTIYPDNVTPVEVYCDQDTAGGGWAVFQRRQNGSVDFYRNWADYQNQFGDLNGEFWIGLDALHTLTSSQPQELRVDLTKWDLNRVSASYSGFTISDGDDNYRLKIASFLGGSAGDSLIKYNSGMQFSTNDTDHDVWGGGSCAEWLHGAWWYETCSPSNLNGQYKHSALNKRGLFWHSAEGVSYSMKATEMKMRPAKPTSCVDSRFFSLVSGVVTIYPDNVTPVEVYCDQDTDGGGWAVFQRRQNGSVDFYRNWADYQNQFGDLNGEFWIGLDALHTLTSSQPQELRVDLTKWDLNRVSASYSGFTISDGDDNYRLKIASFLGGSAGDSLIKYNSGMQFSTNDTDHDVWGGGSCAEWLHGAWWYETCSPSNLNGQYKHSALNKGGLFWHSAEGVSYSMKATEMKMRPS